MEQHDADDGNRTEAVKRGGDSDGQSSPAVASQLASGTGCRRLVNAEHIRSMMPSRVQPWSHSKRMGQPAFGKGRSTPTDENHGRRHPRHDQPTGDCQDSNTTHNNGDDGDGNGGNCPHPPGGRVRRRAAAMAPMRPIDRRASGFHVASSGAMAVSATSLDRRRSSTTIASAASAENNEAKSAIERVRCGVHWISTVVAASVGVIHQPFALPSTSSGPGSMPLEVRAVQPSLKPSPSTTQQPVGHGGTSTMRSWRPLATSTVWVGSIAEVAVLVGSAGCRTTRSISMPEVWPAAVESRCVPWSRSSAPSQTSTVV